MMIHSRRFIDGRDKRIALQGKQKIVGVLIRLSSEEIYNEVAHNIDRFTRSAKLFQRLVQSTPRSVQESYVVDIQPHRLRSLV